VTVRSDSVNSTVNDSNSKTMASGIDEIVCGFHAVESALARAVDVVLDERRHDARAGRLQVVAARAGVTVRRAERAELDALADGVKHQGVVARLKGGDTVSGGKRSRNSHRDNTVRAQKPRHDGHRDATKNPATDATGLPGLHRHLDRLQHPPLLLILDRIQDPRNLGACLRAADGAGADAVVAPQDGACKVTPVVARVAAGAAARVPVYRVANLARALRELRARGVWLTGADAGAEVELYEVDLRAPAAVVLGAEGRGLRRLTRETCDQLARIPLAADGVASLNVAVAAGVFLFEAVRQRRG